MTTITTASGRSVSLVAPQPGFVDLLDIAHALAHLCRFNGHTTRFYSVAQHSVLVARLVPPRSRLVALLHDAHEAYLGDMTRPVKQLLGDPLGLHAQLLDQAILHALLPPGDPFKVLHDGPPRLGHETEARLDELDLLEQVRREIDHADLVALATEKRDLLRDRLHWPELPPASFEPIVPLDPLEARWLFVDTFRNLYDERRASL